MFFLIGNIYNIFCKFQFCVVIRRYYERGHATNILQQIFLLHVTYSVTQSYANYFGGDVVLDTSKYVSRDEDNILDQIYMKQICPKFNYDDFLFS